MINKRGQVTIFIIIAVMILALVAAYLIIKEDVFSGGIPADIQPAYSSFLTCFEENIATGVNLLEFQGGYITLPQFEPGSSYMPFSSQLSLAGNPIPYWYYVSGNNLEKDQVPSKSDMEEQLSRFIEDNIRTCNLQDYYDQGFEITLREPEARVTIEDNEIEVYLEMPMTLQKENNTASLKNHKVTYTSKLGRLYDSAKEIYDEEQETLFLENYGIDVLRNYAPVDGAEITCSPLTWNAEQVFNDIQEGIDENMQSLKNKGTEDDYFALNLPTQEDVRFITSKNWPNSLEVLPADNALMIATPVGNQPGLGIIGFCYAAYHFVYNLKYPVLVQVGSLGEEVFQFPLAVVIQGNQPRKSLNATAVGDLEPELCKYPNTEIEVRTYDSGFRPIDADMSYECGSNTCNIGKTSKTNGILKENFPQCANGYMVAKADGFKDTRYLFSTVQSGSLDMILEKTYETEIQLFLDSSVYDGNAMITVSSDYAHYTLIYPQQRTIDLGEGMHDIDVQLFKNTSIILGETTKEQCVQVPNGVLGFFGFTKDKCFEIQIPEQTISQALSGGGSQTQYILESDLIKGKRLEINAPALPVPKTIDEVSNNYLILEQNKLEVEMA